MYAAILAIYEYLNLIRKNMVSRIKLFMLISGSLNKRIYLVVELIVNK